MQYLLNFNLMGKSKEVGKETNYFLVITFSAEFREKSKSGGKEQQYFPPDFITSAFTEI